MKCLSWWRMGAPEHGSLGFSGSYKYPTLPPSICHQPNPLPPQTSSSSSPSLCNWHPVVSTSSSRPLLDAVVCLSEKDLFLIIFSPSLIKIMSASLSNNSLRLSSPLKVEEEAHLIHKQGIVSILRSDCERSKVMSLRRTLSADMSKWLAHDDHHHHPMKKIASSQEFPILSTPPDSSSEEEEDDWNNHHLERRSQSDVWRSIQKEKERKEMEKVGQFDIWSSILCQKAEEDSAKLSLPPPYIHPLVKRSSSSLTEKSLEICTESLGSETGADGFSSYSASEIGDTEDEGDQVVSSRPQPHQQLGEERESLSFDRDEYRGLKYNRKFPPPLRSFPPPLPSLNSRNTSLHMHSRRENGRFVLEAVSVPSRNCFRVQRQDGRLLLTLVNSPSQEPIHDNHEEAIDQEEDKVEEFEEVFENEAEIRSEEDYEEEEDDEDEEEEEMVEKENGGNEMGIVIEQGVPKLLSGVINVHRSAPMMKKLMGIENRINSPWGTPKFNKSVNLMGMDVEEDEEEEVANPLPQSLPPPTRVARLIRTPPAAVTATSFNAYEYFWRTKPAGVATMMGPLTQPCPPLKNSCNKVILSNSSPKAYKQQDLVLYRGNKADCLVPSLGGSGCKEPKRSLLIWEPYCIATS